MPTARKLTNGARAAVQRLGTNSMVHQPRRLAVLSAFPQGTPLNFELSRWSDRVNGGSEIIGRCLSKPKLGQLECAAFGMSCLNTQAGQGHHVTMAVEDARYRTYLTTLGYFVLRCGLLSHPSIWQGLSATRRRSRLGDPGRRNLKLTETPFLIRQHAVTQGPHDPYRPLSRACCIVCQDASETVPREFDAACGLVEWS